MTTAAAPTLLAGMIICTALVIIALAVTTIDNLATRRTARRTAHDANTAADRAEATLDAIRDLHTRIASLAADLDAHAIRELHARRSHARRSNIVLEEQPRV